MQKYVEILQKYKHFWENVEKIKELFLKAVNTNLVQSTILCQSNTYPGFVLSPLQFLIFLHPPGFLHSLSHSLADFS